MAESIFPFLQEPWFVISWFLFGFLSAIWVTYDVFKVNTHVNQSLKYGWPIIVIFFSIIGLVLYFSTCRPFGIKNKTGEEAKEYHHRYVSPKWKKVTGSVIHCVAGDGLGIMTAMIISRLINLNFWPEFCFEYGTGFLFGWLIFQYTAMKKMAGSKRQVFWMAGRAEWLVSIGWKHGMS